MRKFGYGMSAISGYTRIIDIPKTSMRIAFFISLAALQIPAFGKVINYNFTYQCRKATDIFTGRVIQITVINHRPSGVSDFKTYKITFISDKIWKGSVQDTITCIAGEGFCAGNIFELNKSYLVYSEGGEITLGSGRSGEIESRRVKSDMRRLTFRYLFRRPHKCSADWRTACINHLRLPSRSHTRHRGRYNSPTSELTRG